MNDSEPARAMLTLLQADWWDRAFAPGGLGWPLVIIVGAGIGAYRIARFLAPLIQQLVAAVIAFMGALGGQLGRIETTGTETKGEIGRLVQAIEDLAREVREDRLRREAKEARDAG
jgi:hypothetical protein